MLLVRKLSKNVQTEASDKRPQFFQGLGAGSGAFPLGFGPGALEDELTDEDHNLNAAVQVVKLAGRNAFSLVSGQLRPRKSSRSRRNWGTSTGNVKSSCLLSMRWTSTAWEAVSREIDARLADD